MFKKLVLFTLIGLPFVASTLEATCSSCRSCSNRKVARKSTSGTCKNGSCRSCKNGVCSIR